VSQAEPIAYEQRDSLPITKQVLLWCTVCVRSLAPKGFLQGGTTVDFSGGDNGGDILFYTKSETKRKTLFKVPSKNSEYRRIQSTPAQAWGGSATDPTLIFVVVFSVRQFWVRKREAAIWTNTQPLTRESPMFVAVTNVIKPQDIIALMPRRVHRLKQRGSYKSWGRGDRILLLLILRGCTKSLRCKDLT